MTRAQMFIESIECGGLTMSDGGRAADQQDAEATEHIASSDAGTKIGKRYSNEDVGVDVMCVKAGSGSLTVGGLPLSELASKHLPSSD